MTEYQTPTADIVSTAILTARDLITAGHCKGVSHEIRTTGDAYCLSGALCKATLSKLDGEWGYRGIDIYAWARAAVVRCLPEGFDQIPRFNDNDNTTTAQVLEVLTRAAEAVQSGEVTAP